MKTSKQSRDDIKDKLVKSCRILYREVRSVHNPYPIGHFSARIPGTRELLIKPRDVAWNKVTADDIMAFDLEYRKLSGPELEIIELPIHVEMYRSRQDVMAVVHTHQTYATLVGTLGLKLELLDASTLAFANGVPLYDESDDPTYFSEKIRTLIREERQGQILAKKIGNSNAIILKAHGPVVVGKSIEEACMSTILLENAAKAQIIASMVRGRKEPIENLGIPVRTPSVGQWKTLLDSYE
jgi:L-ribulose-5-phosphate 4-epimerase